jgi:hypothetical protein
MSRSLRTLSLGAVVLLCVLASDTAAHAHQPTVFEAGKVLVIEDPILSAALYGEFKGPRDVFEAKMSLTRPLAIPVEVLVPRRDALENHRPIFAIVAAGLPEPTANERALLPRPLPPGTGVIVGSYAKADREVIFESFTRRVFWTNGVTAYVLPRGDVSIWVFAPGGTSGKFVLGFGVEEGSQDLGGVISGWDDYAY